MAQYCEIAKTTTNCTDDCKKCLKEERKENKMEKNFKVGDIVRYLKDTSSYDEADKIYYPPIGTIGKIVSIEEDDIRVQWPEGTTLDEGRWYVGPEDLELVENK